MWCFLSIWRNRIFVASVGLEQAVRRVHDLIKAYRRVAMARVATLQLLFAEAVGENKAFRCRDRSGVLVGDAKTRILFTTMEETRSLILSEQPKPAST